jgi:signal transduction histidine kinase
VLRFEINADRIDFPDFRLSLSASETARVRPFEPAPASTALTADVIAAQYYPRILAFLRDARTGRHTGAQHFLRLRSLIVAPRGSNHGYVITERDVLECINRKLVELCDRQPFTATAWIPDAQHKTASGGVTYGLQNFPFFEVVFAETGSATTMNVRRHAFAYSMTVLVAITVLGSLFVHRALSHDVRLPHLRNDFVAAVSHEFRSPLSSIVALAERLVSHRSVDGAQLAEYHRIIHHDAQRLSALVTRLLEFGRMEEGKDNYSPAQVDLTVIAQDAINSMGHAVTPGRVRYNGTANAPLWVRADATALCLAIQNLVENAAKYSPADSPIDVTCAAENGWHA